MGGRVFSARPAYPEGVLLAYFAANESDYDSVALGPLHLILDCLLLIVTCFSVFRFGGFTIARTRRTGTSSNLSASNASLYAFTSLFGFIEASGSL